MAIEIVYEKDGKVGFSSQIVSEELDRLEIIDELKVHGYKVIYCEFE